MTDTTNELSKAERVDHATTIVSGWAAVVIGVLGLHRFVAVGFDRWAQVGIILALGLALMWVWGFWGQITQRLKHWVSSGGLNTTLIAVGLVVVLIIVNTMVRRRIQVKVDLTKNKRFTLAPRTREILKSLKGPVQVTLFLPTGRSGGPAKDIFKQFADASDKFNWTQVDPLTNPQAVLTRNPQPKLNPSTLTGALLEYNGKRQDVSEFTEKDITSALLKLTRDSVRKIAFLQGHGEADPTAAPGGATNSIQVVVTDLKDSDWPVTTLDLYSKSATTPDPTEIAEIVIAGPEKPFTEGELKHLNAYLEKGGRVLLLLNSQGPTFTEFLKPWGITTTNDLVLDPSQGVLITGADRDAHVAIRPAKRVLLQISRSVRAASPAPAGVTVTELLKSGPSSQVIPNFDPKKQDVRQALATAQPGAVSVAALAEKSVGTGADAPKAKLIVVGDATFMADQLAQSQNLFNRDMSTGLINYLGEEEALVQIAPKDENTEQAFLTPDQGRLLPLIHLLDFPLLALLLAVIVYVKRR